MAIRTDAIEEVTRTVPQRKNVSTKRVGNKDISFDEVFKKKVENVRSIKFSVHAQKRLNSRNIILKPQDLNKIENAVSKAASKGSSESLLIMDDLALIVSIKNRTVITAISGDSLKDNVFTNIDSAVIVGQA